MTKSPVSVVTAGVDFVPGGSLVSTTVAPGITAPVRFFTLPATVPVVICASNGGEIRMIVTITLTTTPSVLRPMSPPSACGWAALAVDEIGYMGATLRSNRPAVKKKRERPNGSSCTIPLAWINRKGVHDAPNRNDGDPDGAQRSLGAAPGRFSTAARPARQRTWRSDAGVRLAGGALRPASGLPDFFSEGRGGPTRR